MSLKSTFLEFKKRCTSCPNCQNNKAWRQLNRRSVNLVGIVTILLKSRLVLIRYRLLKSVRCELQSTTEDGTLR